MSSIWDDVRWDEAAAEELVGQLLATAAAVGEAAAALGRSVPVERGDWGGPHRDAFDTDHRRVVGAAEHLAEALVAAARRAAALAETAAGEQRLRVRLRLQHEAASGAGVPACRPGRPC